MKAVQQRGRMRVAFFAAWFAVGAVTALAAPAAGPLASALTPADVDVTASAAWVGAERLAAPENGLLATLGLRAGEPWLAGRQDQGGARLYLVCFARPVPVGSVLCQARGTLQRLKPDAPFPPDPARAADWVDIDFPPAQSGWRTAALPPDTMARAILLRLPHEDWDQARRFQCLRLFVARLHNIVPDGLANGEDDYISYGDLRPPIPYVASNITRGIGGWQSHGPDNTGRIPRVPVTDLAPIWFVLSWDEPQAVGGFLLDSNFRKFRLLVYRGPAGVNPAVGGDKDWENVKFETRADAGGVWLSFAPSAARGFKFVAWDVKEGRFGAIAGLQAFTDLKAASPPPRRATALPPPFAIRVPVPAAGTLSMAVDDLQGRRVRTLAARMDVPAGERIQSWDLKDENGRFVPPGTYRWKALSNPGLEVRYEMTPYPNIEANAPENSPWLNGHSGSGGWLADHTPPRAVSAAGDRLFFSAPCAESGVALIECDLDGRKRWGHHNIIAWTGPSYLASDAQALYAATTTGDTDYVWRFALADRKLDTFLQLNSTATRRRGLCGLAVHDGKLYLSVQPAAGTSWLDNAASAADIDSEQCEPKYAKPKDRGGKPDDPDYPQDFLRLFRLTGTPPGCNGLTWLETAREPAARQHIVLSFKKPVPVGSFVFPLPEDKTLHLRISVLKADAPYPPEPGKEEQWLPVWKGNGSGWMVIAAPENTLTRAVRLSFDHGMDELDELLEKDTAGADGLTLAASAKADAPNAWSAKLEGMKILRRRFANLFSTCKVTVNSGSVNKDGEWDAGRERPLTPDNPAIYQMEWEAPQPLRGLAIKEIDGRFTEIDAWTGAGKPDMKSATGWEKIATYEQKLRYYYSPDQNHNSQARYLDGYVDFGREVTTRALRLRVIEQWMWKEEDRAGCVGVRKDRGDQTLDPTRCRVYGVAPLQYVAGEAPVDAAGAGRIEVYDLASRKLAQEVTLAATGDLAFGPKGELYAASAGKVVRVDLTGGKPQALPLEVKWAMAIVCDKSGKLYVYDSAADQRVVKVFDPAAGGKPLRTIGTAGGRVAGPWDPSRFASHAGVAVDLEIDSKDQLWVVECDYTPKRISCWSLDGTFKKDFLGNTAYGGGGCLDPVDKSRLFYGPMEFALDWKTGASRLKGITWLGDSPAGEQPLRIGERQYLVTRPMFCGQAVGVVYLYDNGRLKRLAAVGRAGNFPALRTSPILEKLGRKAIGSCAFAWSDRNGDELPQPDEVQFFDLADPRSESVGRFEESLAIDAGSVRYEVKEILPSGAPLYERKAKAVASKSFKLNNGTFFVTGERNAAALDAKGQPVWTHAAEGWGVHALYSAKPYSPGQVVAQFDVVGHETAPGALGEFLVTNSNTGVWHIWTADGLLAGRIFRDQRGPGAKPWSMSEHNRGLDLSDVTVGQEHFSGYFCRSAQDGKYYAVAGHNHVSIAEVQGLDKITRLGGDLTVGQPELTAAIEWDRRQQARKLYETAKVIVCRRAVEKVVIDGKFDDWSFTSARLPERSAEFAMTFDDSNLYLCFRIMDCGPLRNTGNDWRRLFKTGAAVDLQIGADPAAPEERREPARGDARVLITVVNGEPVVVLYQPVAPDAKPDEAWETHTSVFRAAFDRVVKLAGAKVAVGAAEGRAAGPGYQVEVALPLAALGLTPQEGQRLKLDWGVLSSGPDGSEVLQRLYWANQQTAIVSDEAAEAALRPDLWGYVRFAAGEKVGGEMSPDKLLPGGAAGAGDAGKLELDEL